MDRADGDGRLRLLRRILIGLVMTMVALLPAASHAAGTDAAGMGAPGTIAPHTHAAAAAHAHDRHAGMDCAGHRHRDVPPCRQPCRDCAMGCCAPAIVDFAAPAAVAARAVMLLRRSPPAADLRRADASCAEHLRPPIPL